MNRRTFLKAVSLLPGLPMAFGLPITGRSSDYPVPKEAGRHYAFEDPGVLAERGGARTVAVLGGGVAGLAAARVLAQAGCEVHLFEAGPTCGGFCSTMTIGDFRFDLGPHLFNPNILRVAPVTPADMEPEHYSESIFLDGDMLKFPWELLKNGFGSDAVRTLVETWFADTGATPKNFVEYARRSYGRRVTKEIFRPLIEKWCSSPMDELATSYMASRMAGKVTTENAIRFALQKVRGFLPIDRPPPRPVVEGFPPAPAYAGRTGAEVIPISLGTETGDVHVHLESPVTSVTVRDGRITKVSGGDVTVAPDGVVNTLPLNVFARMVEGDRSLSGLQDLSYLHVIFVMARIARKRVTNAKWVWIPSGRTPFYRISEMKALGPQHAPPDATGLCMELSLREDDPAFNAAPARWIQPAVDFLDSYLGVKKSEIIGLTVVRRKYAYPLFTRANAETLKPYLDAPYTMNRQRHVFNLPVTNLSLAGRSGRFLYLLTPAAVRSGLDAGAETLERLKQSDSKRRARLGGSLR